MVFIEGVGYVNDSSAVATPNRTQSVSETTPNFVGMLRTETDKLNQASVTTNLDFRCRGSGGHGSGRGPCGGRRHLPAGG